MSFLLKYSKKKCKVKLLSAKNFTAGVINSNNYTSTEVYSVKEKISTDFNNNELSQEKLHIQPTS